MDFLGLFVGLAVVFGEPLEGEPVVYPPSPGAKP